MRRLFPEEAARLSRAANAAPPSLAEFVHATCAFKLDPWQLVLCWRLQRLCEQTGQRLLIHAAPQAGKSVIMSQRFPAYYLGRNPLARVKLACYNITHATRFGAVCRDVAQGGDYRKFFPGVVVPPGQKRDEWSTAARAALGDGQPSFAALGLQTGFVGQGADCFPAGTPVRTEVGDVDISTLARLECPPMVYAFDHDAGRVVPRRIEAAREVSADELVEVETVRGRKLRCTPDHRFFIPGRGYVAAQALAPGTPLSVCPGSGQAPAGEPGHALPPATPSEDAVAVVRKLRQGRERVYDLQVEGCRNFFAEGILVHNCLIIDDPYASPQDAASEAIRESVWTFWDESARVRLADDANVVVMFHRYGDNDLAGRLMETDGLVENGGKWELLRFAAIADGRGHDPMNRPVGQKLSPRMSDAYLAEQQKSGFAWEGQFQGVPGRKGGNLFQVDRLQVVAAAPAQGVRCRGWDMAATQDAGKYTAGVLINQAYDGLWYVEGVVRGQWETARRDRVVRQTAELDGHLVRQQGEQEGGSGGKDQARAFVRLLRGFSVGVTVASSEGGKSFAAEPFSAQVNAGNVRLVRGDWNKAFIDEFRAFPAGKYSDQVDAASKAFNWLARRREAGAVG